MTLDTGDSKEVAMVEEGTADNKSDAGSATTTPSLESSDSKVVPNATESKGAGRLWLLGGAALLLVAGAVTTAALLAGGKDQPVTVASSSSSQVTVSTGATVSLGGEEEAPVFEPTTFDPPFEPKELPLFGKETLEAYESREALENDLTIAAERIVNNIILQNLQYVANGTQDEFNDALVSAASASAKQASQKKASQFTNNQEPDADEADYLKTDGQYVYASYGEFLVVWDLKGDMVTHVQMPAAEEAQAQQGDDDMYQDPYLVDGMNYAYVETIQLTDKHVLIVVGGLGQYDDDGIAYGHSTHIRVYNKPTSEQPILELVATRDIQGTYYESKYLEATNTIHIIGGGDFNTYSALIEPLEAYNFEGSTAAQYYEIAAKRARDELIPAFVKNLADFFMADGQLPTVLKVNSWKTQNALADAPLNPQGHYTGSYDEPIRCYVQISSIAVDSIPAVFMDEPLEMTTTAVLGPSSWGNIYATGDSILTQLTNYEYNDVTGHTTETTFFLHFKVIDQALQLYTTHSTPGHLASPKAVDISGNDLRIAMTQQKWVPLENVWPVCGDSWYFEDECMNEDNWNDCFDVAISCRNVQKKGCPYTFVCLDEDEMGSSTDNIVSVLDISQPGEMQEIGSVRIGEPHEVIVAVHFGESFSYANTFDQRDPFYVLQLEPGKAPVLKGQLKLDGFANYLQPISDDGSLIIGIGQNVTGEGLEQMNSGLMVTVYDVSNPAEPKALTSQMLVDPQKAESFSEAELSPKAVQYNNGILVIPLSLYSKYNSSSEGEWTENDFGEWIETTTAPMEEEEPRDFEGFVVFDVRNVQEQGLKEVARIDHSPEQSGGSGEDCHYCNGNLFYKRSFLFDDMTLMTVYDSKVQSTNVTTGQQLWSMEITIDGVEKNCCY